MPDPLRRPMMLAVLLAAAAAASALWPASAQPSGWIEIRNGEPLPDWLLEDGTGRRFRLSEMRGRPLVLTVGMVTSEWRTNVEMLQEFTKQGERAAVLHLVVLRPASTDDAPGAPPIPAKDPAQVLRENLEWLAKSGVPAAQAARRVHEGPGEGFRMWHRAQSPFPIVAFARADGVVQQVFLGDTSANAKVIWQVLYDAAIACAGGGPPMLEQGRALVASGRLTSCGRQKGPPP
jgi:hypothetical protein